MMITKSTQLSPQTEEDINNLWNEEYPVQLKNRFPLLLNGVPRFTHYLLSGDDQQLMGWAVAFFREDAWWFSLIVASRHQRKGLGSILIKELKADHQELYGWVIDHTYDVKNDGSPYQSPLPFYLKHHFAILNEERIDNDMLHAVKIRWTAG